MAATNYNYAISLCRVVAMAMIIICHIATSTNNSALAQFFQVGVQMFLFISGYLYSRKAIDNSRLWVIGRLKRVSVPCYIWIALLWAFAAISGWGLFPAALIVDALNLEGYQHIITFLPSIAAIPGTAHLWFITALFLDYLIMLGIKRVEHRVSIQCWAFSLVALAVIGAITGYCGIRLDYIWIYFIGYFLGKRVSWKKNGLYLMSVIILAMIAVSARLITKQYYDLHGDTNLYLYVIIPFAYNCLALAICCIILATEERFNVLGKMKDGRIIKVLTWLDTCSFYIYITHYMFIDAPLMMLDAIEPFPIALVAALFLTLITALGLKCVTEMIVKRI